MTKDVVSKEDQLRKVPLFSKLGKKSMTEIARIADVVDVPAGEVFVKQGELGNQFIMILEGKAKVEKDGKLVNHLSPNDFFGEVALIANRPRTATVTAETAMRVLAVERGYFDDLLENTPGLWKEIAIALCHYIPNKE
jgi:CRP-like cAMP-binding protein